ncbi:MAG: tRNA (adenosine(37)-N6)-threonylcarbamoyltransferase complex ATPase subunit type 1 TsaE [Ruminococcaceae bacterium]|nr:tRNA (adenosine(37)-N6)-threonylcarbamoyltransferase complex ATPase subunit type 1 TsaE [Oscillospiraceae bacterium]
MVYLTKSVAETEKLAEEFASNVSAGTVLALFGGMGVGKTAFTRGLARGLGITQNVSSPTFAIVNDYGGNPPLAHFDMYRIESWEDLYSTGFFDYIDQGYVICIEWSENIENALPSDAIRIYIAKGEGENDRIITVEKP